MIFKHELVEKIRFKHIKETHEITEDHNRAFDSIIGEAIVLKGENYDIEDVAGTIEAHFFNLIEFEGSIFDLLDPISSTVGEVGSRIRRPIKLLQSGQQSFSN